MKTRSCCCTSLVDLHVRVATAFFPINPVQIRTNPKIGRGTPGAGNKSWQFRAETVMNLTQWWGFGEGYRSSTKSKIVVLGDWSWGSQKDSQQKWYNNDTRCRGKDYLHRLCQRKPSWRSKSSVCECTHCTLNIKVL